MRHGIVHVVSTDKEFSLALRRAARDLECEALFYEAVSRFFDQAVWGVKAALALDIGDAQADIVDVLEALPVGDPIRVMVIAGAPTVGEAVSIMKLGAVDYLQKPVTEDVIHMALKRAMISSETALEAFENAMVVRERLASLSRAEHEVLIHLTRGATSNEIARILHRSERTIGNHRQHILNKMQVRNTIELINLLKAPLVDAPQSVVPLSNGVDAGRPPHL